MNTLPEKDRAALRKVLALLASDKPGEVQAAASAATRLLLRHNLQWPDLLALPPRPQRQVLHAQWRSVCAELAKRPGDLRAWERRFVADLPNFTRLSTKQRYVLVTIAERVLCTSQEPTS